MRIFSLICLILIILALPLNAQELKEVRVGIVASENFTPEFKRWSECFNYCNEKSDVKYDFKLAAGTYGDLVHWMSKGLIDLAIITPGVFSEVLSNQINGNTEYNFDYLATQNMKTAKGLWATEGRRKKTLQFTYHSVCVVPRDSPIKNFEDIKFAASLDRLEYIFVDPLSVSGCIAPLHILKKEGIIPERDSIRYGYSHTNVLKILAEKTTGKMKIGFTFDDAISYALELKPKLKRIRIPELDKLVLPNDIVAIKRGFDDTGELSRLLLQYSNADGKVIMEPIKTGAEAYNIIYEMTDLSGINNYQTNSQTVSLDEISQILLHTAQNTLKPPKLALVLSGGGAKCSYQVGAIAAIEEKLEELRKIEPEFPLEIDLVVGTSGGAYNAIPVSQGITRTKEGREDFKNMWKSLDQREMIIPAFSVQVLMGIWILIIQIFLILMFCRIFIPRIKYRVPAFFIILFLISFIELIINNTKGIPWHFLGENHLIHHSWMWISFGVNISSKWIFLISVAGLFFSIFRYYSDRPFLLHTKKFIIVSIILIFLMPIITAFVFLFKTKTLSSGAGVENTLFRTCNWITNRELKRQGLEELKISSKMNSHEKLSELSKQLISRKLMKHDLVVTVNCIDKSVKSLPNDLYFYTSNSPEEFPFGERGISINDRPEFLMDVIMGSMSIFPVFPARNLKNFPEKQDFIEIVDGGFAHNSPIEAAVICGATHIILIEATPKKRRTKNNLAENAASAFEHLLKQTQLIDLRSKQQIVVFTLAPEEQKLCVLDFSNNLVEQNIIKGYRDARSEIEVNGIVRKGQPLFKKELGEPVFSPIYHN